MIDLHGPRIMIGVLVLLTTGAMGIALSGLPLLRITSFDVIADDDSLRTEPLVELMEELYGLCQPITNEADITGKIASFPQVDQVFVEKAFLGAISIRIITRKPVLKISLDHSEPVCLAPDGSVFPFWPEHGELPTFSTGSLFSREQLLIPDETIQDYYRILLQLLKSPGCHIQDYSRLTECGTFDMVFQDPVRFCEIRLSRDATRYTEAVLMRLDDWISSQQESGNDLDYDARFPGMIIVRQNQEGFGHG